MLAGCLDIIKIDTQKHLTQHTSCKVNSCYVQAVWSIKHAKATLCMHGRGVVTSRLWLYVKQFSSFRLTDTLIFGSNLRWERAMAPTYYSFMLLQIIHQNSMVTTIYWRWKNLRVRTTVTRCLYVSLLNSALCAVTPTPLARARKIKVMEYRR